MRNKVHENVKLYYNFNYNETSNSYKLQTFHYSTLLA